MALTRWRVLLVIASGLVLAVVAGGVFDQFVPALVVPPLLVGVTSLVFATRSRLVRHVATGAAVVVAAAASVAASGGSFSDATTGIWSGPRRLITTEWPSPVEATVVGAIALVLAVGTAAAADLALNPRWRLAPTIPLGIVLAITLLLGAPARPSWLLIAALGVIAAMFAVVRHGADRPAPRWFLTERTVVVSAGAIALAAIVTSGAVAWADRADPRRTEDAELIATLLDPIEATVALRRADPELELFEVVDRSTLVGPSLPARWRMAALDTYDGQRWVPRLTLRRIGQRLGLPSAPSPDVPPPIRYSLTILTDDIDVLPFPGRPLSVDRDVETDVGRVAVRLIDRPSPGTVVRAESEIAPSVTAATSVATRQVDEIAGTFSERARSIAGEGTVVEQLRALETSMREWRLDSSAPGGGQQLALIERFVTVTERGTREQFVTAFVLLVRSLGFDARIATGFVVPPDEARSSPLTIRSGQAAVWPEVRLDGVGWLAFDPVPSSEADENDEPPPPPEAQSPAAAQPPIVPPADDADDADDPETVIDTSGSGWGSLRTWVVRGTVVSGVALLPFVSVALAIVAIKGRRRRRRLRAAHAAVRIRGAWANATDSLVDAGLSIGPAWTDERIADAAMPIAPGSPHETRRLAAMSTAMTFGGVDDAWRLVDDAVLTSAAIDDAILEDRTRWERILWRLSLRSLRRATRSPIDL